MKFIQEPNCGCNLRCRLLALNTARCQNDLQRRIPALDHMQHIANRRAGGRSDQPDSLRKFRKPSFAFRRKQAFGAQFLFELLESHLQRADPLQFDRRDS